MISRHVSISLTTISSRLETVGSTIESLLGQDYPSFDISLYISSTPYLIDQGVDELPAHLSELQAQHRSVFKIVRVPNIGSYRKLIPWLASHKNHQGLVATADDDTVYPSSWLGRLVKAYERHRCIICYRGHSIVTDGKDFAPYRRWMKSEIDRNPSIYILPTGKDGVLYHTAHFHEQVTNIEKALELAPTADDLWFKWHTAAVGVEVYCINTDYGSMSFPDTSGEGGTLYDNYNRTGKNDEAIANMRRYGEKELGVDLANINPIAANSI